MINAINRMNCVADMKNAVNWMNYVGEMKMLLTG